MGQSVITVDATVSAVAETATGSGVWGVTLLPTAGVGHTRPSDIVIDGTGGIQVFFTAASSPLAVGERFKIEFSRLT